MSEISTSGPIDVSFLTENEIHTSYEEMPSRGFNPLVKAIRQGRWFMLKGLKAELRDQVVYQEWLKKEYALMVQLDHPNIVKAYAKEVNELLGPCIVMEYVDGVTLDSFLDGNPSREARLKVLDQLTGEGRAFTLERRRSAILQTACKHAVKGGDPLSEEDIRSLVSRMIDERVTPTCPHGRPLVVAISHTELDRKFKRIQA